MKCTNKLEHLPNFIKNSKYEAEIPMEEGKYVFKSTCYRNDFSWMIGVNIDRNGNLYRILEIKKNETDEKKSTCLMESEEGHSMEISAENVLIEMQKIFVIQARFKNKYFTFPTMSNDHSVQSSKSLSSGGYSKIFIQPYVQESEIESMERYKNCSEDQNSLHLQVIDFNERIFPQLLHGSGPRFIENTNLHNIQRWKDFSNVLVAYCKKSSNEKKMWRLGLICFHSFELTIIQPMILYFSKNGQMRYEDKCYQPSKFLNGDVDIVYLNFIGSKMNIANDGCIKSLIHGPDILTFRRSHKVSRIVKAMKKKFLTSNESTTALSHFPKITKGLYEWRNSDKSHHLLLEVLRNDMRNYVSKKKKVDIASKKSVNTKGSLLVKVHCSLDSLHFLKNSNCFLVPYPTTEFDGKVEFVRYALIPMKKYKVLLQGNGMYSVKEFENILDKCSDNKSVLHRILKMPDRRTGLIISFIENSTRTLDEFGITTSVLTKHLEHNEIDGTVMSHWFKVSEDDICNTDFLSIGMLEEIEKTYGIGFGSRKSVKSRGINLYLGAKNTVRVRTNTRLAKEDVYNSQMWRQSYNATYEPVIRKKVKSLTIQAVNIMTMADRTYDRIIHKVHEVTLNKCDNELIVGQPNVEKKRKQEHNNNRLGRQFIGDRRLCNWSLVTAGQSNVSYSFINQIHVDSKDIFNKNVQEKALQTLRELNKRYQKNNKLCSEILYYLDHVEKLGGLSIPTTCGYKIIENKNFELDGKPRIMSFFSLTGLGVSIEISSDVYHYFYGGLYSHCTPATIAIKNGKVYLHGDDFNVFAWGASGI